MDIGEFPSLYGNSDIGSISSCRKESVLAGKKILAEPACELVIDDFAFSGNQHRYSVTNEGVKFEMLFLDNNASEKLYISLSSAIHPFYPKFLRWSWARFLDAKFLCIDDPMYADSPLAPKVPRWYYGTAKKSYLSALIPIIHKIIEKLRIKPEQVVFLGSSGGGYAALYLANAISGCTAFALNPQIVPALWSKGRYAREYWTKLKINLASEDHYRRNNIILTNEKSRFFISFNYASSLDRVQLAEFFRNQHFSTNQYGITQHGNVILWLHNTPGKNRHNCNPEKLEIKIMEFLLDQINKGEDINSFSHFSQVISEYLSERYVHKKDMLKMNELIESYEKKIVMLENELNKKAQPRRQRPQTTKTSCFGALCSVFHSFCDRIRKTLTARIPQKDHRRTH